MKLNYKGLILPISEKDIIPTIKNVLETALENIKNDKVEINKKTVIELLETLQECTEPTPFFYNEYAFSP